MKRVLHLVRGQAPPPEIVGPHDSLIAYDEVTPEELLGLITEHDLVVVW